MFDFGGVTFGDSKTLPITFNNESEIEAKLFLDLRELPEFEIMIDEGCFEDEDIRSEIM
jgi:hypothetical protein